MTLTIILILGSVAAYLIGSANGAIMSSKLFYRKDIRQYGSGNAGLTNFLRVFGKTGLALVLLVDIGKTVLAVCVSGLIYAKAGGDGQLGRLIFGFFTMLGHVFPVFYRFRGGKAVLTAGTMVLLFDWRIGLIVLSVFALFVLVTRFVSLGSIMAGVSFPVCLICFGYGPLYLVIGTVCAALMIGRHHENILRLIKGRESKLSY